MYTKGKFDIYDRSFDFAVRVVNWLERSPKSNFVDEYRKQLIRSSGSIGANIEEADGALTRKDFINKLGIARRESQESGHWLKLIKSTLVLSDESLKKELDSFVNKSVELRLILSAITKNTQQRINH